MTTTTNYYSINVSNTWYRNPRIRLLVYQKALDVLYQDPVSWRALCPLIMRFSYGVYKASDVPKLFPEFALFEPARKGYLGTWFGSCTIITEEQIKKQMDVRRNVLHFCIELVKDKIKNNQP